MAALPATNTLDLDLDGEWLTVWFNEPEKRNPLSEERAGEIRALCAALKGRRDIRGVTFRGRGGVFSAGGDLKAFKAVFQGQGTREDVIAMSLGAGDMLDAVNNLEQVTVMAIEGAAMAGGLGLACAGDVVIARRDARFSLTEAMIGLTPAQIAPFVIARLGQRTARRLMLTAAAFDGAQAVALGLADEAVGDDAAMDAAIAAVRKQDLKCAPGAVAGTKALVLALPNLDRDGQKRMAAENFADRMLSEEGREGVASFIEKRKPRWAE